ncbi:kinase [Aureimonas altamirensis]|uniref:GHMP family kinase ATP-binding protein n=1 Tax=Aureimonas altamirensis TaxID=370622 RepID=UPI001E3A7BD7|nr:kinase [Aureimonas altamirensis]UHD46363.1 kinase [Aureimonas altamirensis]
MAHFPMREHVSGARDHSKPARKLRVGTGQAIAHHGELLQGVFPDSSGRLHRALATLPLADRVARVTFWPDDMQTIATRPLGRSKAALAARLALDLFGYPGITGSVTIESTVPLSCGFGSSTADVVATIRAVADAARAQISRPTLCRLAVAAEIATDAIVFETQAVLFAHREGTVLEYLAGDVPPIIVVGFACPDDAPIETIDTPPARYASQEIEVFRVLRGLLRRAIAKQDVALLGHVSTTSARINQRHFPKRRFDDLKRMSEIAGGCGIQVAHSGTRMGILIDARLKDRLERAAAITRQASAEGFVDIICFTVGADALDLSVAQ